MSSFRFKEFSIAQQHTAMKVSTDGILLGAWCELGRAQQMIDIGTGTGLIALMCAQRQPLAYIHALEIEPAAYQQACENVQNSPWAARVNVHFGAAQTFKAQQKADLIVSNPPYFQDALLGPNEARNLARHTHTLPLGELIALWQRLGHEHSEFALILPYQEAQIFGQLAQQCGAHLVRLTEVKSTASKAVSRWLMQWSWHAKTCQKETLIIHQGNDYSASYKALCRDFYLRF